MGRGGQEQEMSADVRKHFAKTIALTLFEFLPIPKRRHLMRLIHDDQVKAGGSQCRCHILLLGEVNRSDQLAFAHPYIFSIRSIHQTAIHLDKMLLEAVAHFPLPLLLQMPWSNDQRPLDQVAEFQFLDDQPRHNGLTRARIICDQKADTRQLEHKPIYRLDLVGERVHLAGIHRQQRVIQGCIAISLGFQRKKDTPRLCAEKFHYIFLHGLQVGCLYQSIPVLA